MKYNPVSDTVISGDTKGIIEYWSPATLQFPEDEYVLVPFLFQIPFLLPISVFFVFYFPISWRISRRGGYCSEIFVANLFFWNVF